MAINCQELKELLKNEPDTIKDIVSLKKISIAYGLDDIENIEKELDRLISKTKSRNIKKYLQGVKAINHNAFLIYQKSMGAQSGAIDAILKKKYDRILNSIKTKEDLKRIVDNQKKFIENMNNIYNIINTYKIDINKTQLKSYINNILLAKEYNASKAETLLQGFEKFLLNKINEKEILKGNDKVYKTIKGYIDTIMEEVNVKELPFTEGDKLIFNYRDKITDEMFQKFLKNKDKYIKQAHTYYVVGKLKAISNYQAFNHTYDEFSTELKNLLEGTKKDANKLLSTLEKQKSSVSKIIENGKFVDNVSVLRAFNRNKIQDKLGKLSFKITGFDINIPLSEQKIELEDKLKKYIGDDNIKVSIVDTQGEIPVFKIEGQNYVEYVPVKDFNNLGDVLYSIYKLNKEDADVVINGFEQMLEDSAISTQGLNNYLYDTIYGAYKIVDLKSKEDIQRILAEYENPNTPFFGHKIVRTIEGYLMNIELLNERNKFLANILKKHTNILHSTTKGNTAKLLDKILKIISANKTYLKDRLGSILLYKYVDLDKITISELNDIYKKYNSAMDIANELKYRGAIGRTYNVYDIEKALERFDKNSNLNEDGALVSFILKNFDDLKNYDIISYDILDKLDKAISNYRLALTSNYMSAYKDILEEFGLDARNVIESKILEHLNTNNNIVGFNIKAGHTYELVDDIFNEIDEYKKNGFLKTELNKLGLSEGKVKSIYNGLLGKSVYGEGKLPQLAKKTRKYVLTALLSHFSPKSWLLAGYNIVSGGMKAITAFNPNEKLYKEYIDLLKELGDIDKAYYYGVIKDFIDNPVAEDILSAETVKYVDDERNTYEYLAKKAIEFGNKQIDKINKALNKKIPNINMSSQKLGGILAGPIGLADKAVEKYFGVIPKTISESMQELGININELKKLVDEIKQAKKSGNIDTSHLFDLKRELRQYLYNIRAEATYKYQTFYKTASQLGLSRNTLSDHWYINFFSSWGSKTAASFIYGTIGKAYKEAMLACKFQPHGLRMGTFLKVFTDTLLTSPEFNAFIRQLGYASKIVYELNKSDHNGGDINKLDAITQFTIAYQGLASDVISRSIMDMLKTYSTAREEGNSITTSAMYGMLKGVLTASSNAFKELKYAYGPLINGLYQQLKDRGEINSINDIVSNYVDMYTTTYQSLLVSNLGYYLYDKYAGLTYERPDAWQGYNVLEAMLGVELTNYTNQIQKLKDYTYISKFLSKPENFVQGVMNNILGYYYGYGQQHKLDEFTKVLNQDKTFLALRDNGDVSNLDDNIIAAAYKSLLKSRLMSGWSFDKDIKGDYQANLQLVINELRQKGYNIDDVLKAVEYGYINGNNKAALQLQLLGLTKSGQAVLVAEYARQKYKNMLKQYKLTYNIKKVPEDISTQLKKEVLREVSPILSKLDTTYHFALLDNYIRYTYANNPVLKNYGSSSSGGGIRKTKAGEYLQRQMIAELADAADIDWDTTLFNNVSAALFKEAKGENKIKKMAEFFDELDKMNFVGDKGKNVLKAGILYANRKDIKKILSSPYADKFQGAAEQLANILWNFSQDIKASPNILNNLHSSKGRKVHISQITQGNVEAPISKKVYDAIQQLANDVVKLPQFKHIPLQITRKKIKIALQKLGNIELPKDLPSIGKIKQQIQSLHTKTLKTNELKVKKAKPKYKRVKKPRVKPVSSVSNKKSRK